MDTLSRAGHGTALATSMIAVGEAFTKISGDPIVYRSANPANPPSKQLDMLIRQHRLHICWAGHEGHGGGPKVIELAKRVLQLVPGVGVADALIVGCAIACPTTSRLYTTEGRLITSLGLRSLGRQGGRDWEIAEAPQGRTRVVRRV